MKLNDSEKFDQVDKTNLIDRIRTIPEGLLASFERGSKNIFPPNMGIKGVAIAATGVSAVAAEMFLSSAEFLADIPAMVFENGRLPSWVSGKNWLVVAIAFEKNNREIMAMLEQAKSQTCLAVIITNKSKLTTQTDLDPIVFNEEIHPYLTEGYVFGALSQVFSECGLIAQQREVFSSILPELEKYSQTIDASIPTAVNPAKRMAGQLVDTFPVIFGAEHFAHVAQMWKTKINLLAKCFAGCETIPEANHAALSGVLQPEKFLPGMFAIFLQSDNYSQENKNRMDLTFTEFMVAGIGTDLQRFTQKEKLVETWKAALFGTYMAYYLAILFDLDPGSTESIDMFNGQFS